MTKNKKDKKILTDEEWGALPFPVKTEVQFMKKTIIKLSLSVLMIIFMNFGLAGDNPFVDGYHQDTNPFGDGYIQNDNPFGDGYVQDTNPFAEGYVQDTNPYGEGYIQDTNPFREGYVQDKGIFEKNLK